MSLLSQMQSLIEPCVCLFRNLVSDGNQGFERDIFRTPAVFTETEEEDKQDNTEFAGSSFSVGKNDHRVNSRCFLTSLIFAEYIIVSISENEGLHRVPFLRLFVLKFNFLFV